MARPKSDISQKISETIFEIAEKENFTAPMVNEALLLKGLICPSRDLQAVLYTLRHSGRIKSIGVAKNKKNALIQVYCLNKPLTP